MLDPGIKLHVKTKEVLVRRILSIDKQLLKIESEKGITERLSLQSDIYKDLSYQHSYRKSLRLKKMIYILSRERWFLLDVKSRFADGQYLASRLAKSITKVSTKLKKKLTEYNDLGILPLTWKNLTDLSSPVWYEGVLAVNIAVPLSVKLDAIKMLHLLLRSKEEIETLKNDMLNTHAFYMNERKVTMDAIELINNATSCFEQGRLVLLQQKKHDLEQKLFKIKSKFENYVHIDSLPFDCISCIHDDSSLNDESHLCNSFAENDEFEEEREDNSELEDELENEDKLEDEPENEDDLEDESEDELEDEHEDELENHIDSENDNDELNDNEEPHEDYENSDEELVLNDDVYAQDQENNSELDDEELLEVCGKDQGDEDDILDDYQELCILESTSNQDQALEEQAEFDDTDELEPENVLRQTAIQRTRLEREEFLRLQNNQTQSILTDEDRQIHCKSSSVKFILP